MKKNIKSIIGKLSIMLLFIFISDIAVAIKTSSRLYYAVDICNLTHIDDISVFNNNGEDLPDDWIRIGEVYWYCDTTIDEYQKDLGKLVCTFSYEISNTNNKNHGESAILKVYNIEQELKVGNLKMDRDTFYNQLYNKLTKDSASFWIKSKEFEPLLTVTSSPNFLFAKTGEVSYSDSFLVFANDRIYFFNFEKKINNFENIEAESQRLEAFGKRCISLIKGMDLGKFQREKDNEETAKKINEQRKRKNRILYSIPLVICALSIPILYFWRIGRKNKKARV